MNINKNSNKINKKHIILYGSKNCIPPSTEWYNSTYNYNKNISFETSFKDKIVHQIIFSYLNSTPDNLYISGEKQKWLSLNRIFVSKPEIKQNINEINIVVYTFNKHRLFYLKKLFLLNNIYLKKKLCLQLRNKLKILKSAYAYSNPSLFYLNNFITNCKLKNLQTNFFIWKLFKYSNAKKSAVYNLVRLILQEKLEMNYTYKQYISLLYLNNLKFKVLNLIGLKKILSKLYNKKINLNIINLKYLFLENTIFTEGVVRKLRNRKMRVLRLLRKAMKLSTKYKIPILILLNKKKIQKKKIMLFNYFGNKRKLAMNNMKNLFLIGIKIQGNGRLTKRLTASRSVLKEVRKGNFQDILSSYYGFTSKLLRGIMKSNLQYFIMNSKNRNGSFGIKSFISSY